MAIDGREPQSSGIVKIDIYVLDTSDDVPIYMQPIYKVSVLESILEVQ